MLRCSSSRLVCIRRTLPVLSSVAFAAATATSSASPASQLFERCAAARKQIFDLWTASSDISSPATAGAAKTVQPNSAVSGVEAIMKEFDINPATPRENDVIKGLGEAFDRLLLLTVPFSEKDGSMLLESLLTCAARQGREIPVRTIQHLFARCASYPEALAIFYAMRKCGIAMNMEAYYAMVYSLQRLEEESWALKFADEVDATKSVSEQAFDFIVNGCENQLLPENKPWLGQVMYRDQDAASARLGKDAYDALSDKWLERYKQ